MSDVELKPEGNILKPIDAFPRQTAPEATPNVPPVTTQPANGESVPPVTTPAEVTPPVTPPTQPVPPTVPEKKPDEPDYKKKFGESTRRNQIVESQFNELKKTLGDITKQEIPTDEEMVALIPEWDMLSDREKNNEIKLIVTERRLNHVIGTISNIASETENVSTLSKYVESEPRLNGKEDEFIEFASKPNNKGATMEVLLNAFLFETTPIVNVDPIVEKSVEEIPPSLETGTPSGNMPPVKPANAPMDEDDLKKLRTTDPRKYNEMIRTGKIK
jgi:hypothetical protein